MSIKYSRAQKLWEGAGRRTQQVAQLYVVLEAIGAPPQATMAATWQTTALQIPRAAPGVVRNLRPTVNWLRAAKHGRPPIQFPLQTTAIADQVQIVTLFQRRP